MWTARVNTTTKRPFESLKKVFGIVGICPVVRKPVKELEELKKDVVVYVGEMYPEGDKTFKVEARRANKRYPVNSMEINCALGEAVLDAYPEMKVDVHHPDVRLNVEIREEVYLYSEIIPGPGGCLWVPTAARCCFSPEELTARWRDI